MKILLVAGIHWSVPGTRQACAFSPEAAATAAMDMVKLLNSDLDEPIGELPECWKNSLDAVLRQRLAETWVEREIVTLDDLADEAGANVWIEEVAVAGGRLVLDIDKADLALLHSAVSGHVSYVALSNDPVSLTAAEAMRTRLDDLCEVEQA